MQLYFIAFDDADGNNWDLLVKAATPARAIELWNIEFWGAVEDGYEKPEKMFEVNLPGDRLEGVLGWNSTNMIELDLGNAL